MDELMREKMKTERKENKGKEGNTNKEKEVLDEWFQENMTIWMNKGMKERNEGMRELRKCMKERNERMKGIKEWRKGMKGMEEWRNKGMKE